MATFSPHHGCVFQVVDRLKVKHGPAWQPFYLTMDVCFRWWTGSKSSTVLRGNLLTSPWMCVSGGGPAEGEARSCMATVSPHHGCVFQVVDRLKVKHGIDLVCVDASVRATRRN
jgi:hypothetical protein